MRVGRPRNHIPATQAVWEEDGVVEVYDIASLRIGRERTVVPSAVHRLRPAVSELQNGSKNESPAQDNALGNSGDSCDSCDIWKLFGQEGYDPDSFMFQWQYTYQRTHPSPLLSSDHELPNSPGLEQLVRSARAAWVLVPEGD
jgi:hypothetical protein